MNENAVTLLAPKTHQLDVRASVQKFDAGNGEFGTDAVKLVARTVPKKFGVGQGRTRARKWIRKPSLKSTTSSSLRAWQGTWWRSTS